MPYITVGQENSVGTSFFGRSRRKSAGQGGTHAGVAKGEASAASIHCVRRACSLIRVPASSSVLLAHPRRCC
ncbi:hypothetical protein [Streptomyces sp. NPDC088131]|uniref:hypothetical protein n=1 Tax=Streptomyces sp. NPDC088131 TaxID=3365826 RepID=UPI003817D909